MARLGYPAFSNRVRNERVKEAAIAIVVALAILWIAAVSYRQVEFDEDLALASVKRTNQARVQGFEQFVLRTLETADLATRQIEANLSELSRNGLTVADQPILDSPIFGGIVVHRGGSAPIQAGIRPLPPEKLAWLDGLARGGGTDLIVAPPFNDGRGRTQIAVIRNFRSEPGYVAVLMDPQRFTDFAQTIPFGKDDLISLIGLDGVTRARRTGDVLSAGEPVRGLVMERQLAEPNGTYVGPSVLDGIPRIFSHRRIEKYKLFATSGTPLWVVDDRVARRRNFHLFTTAFGIIAILAAGAAIIVSNRRLNRQLRDVEDSNRRLEEAQRIGAIGDWDYYPATDELYWSENLRRMYGRSDGQGVSALADTSRHVAPDDFAKIERQVLSVLERGETATWEIEAVLADGSKSYRRVVAVPIRDQDGEIVGIHGTDQDISHIIQARNLERRLADIARLDSINSLAATLAHELNQPLGITANYLGAAQRTLEQGGSKAKIAEYISSSQEQLHHLAAIIAGARDLVTPGELKSEEVNFPEAIEHVMALLRGHAGKRTVNYTLDIASNLSTIWANAAQVKQVLFNLAKNSLEAVPDKREVSLKFQVRRVSGTGEVRVDVRDNGTGIQDLADPFAALNTTKKTGLGLGLSLARTIVEAHDGKIWVDSTGPEGTTISFTLREGR